jgi:sugar lactone lactonase YvrE
MTICLTAVLATFAIPRPIDAAAESVDQSTGLETILVWGQEGTGDVEFHSPIGIAIDAHDVIYVTEFKNNRVQRFDTAGKFLGKLAVEEMPGGIAVDSHGEIYVAPMMKHKICVYDVQGALLREWGRKGTGDGEFDQPGGITISASGVVYVADQVNRRVQFFSRDGKFLGKWGEYGTAAGQFDGVENLPNRTGGPNFVTVDRQGHVWTTEAKLGRIQKFSPVGRPLLAFGSNSTESGGFGGRPKNLPGPIAVLVDPHDRVWVSATNNRVQAFSATGVLLYGFDSLEPGREAGQFHTPHGLAMDSQDFLYVVDSQNQRIQKVRVPAAK